MANEDRKQRYGSLEDFVTHCPLNVDGQLDDGWGATFAVKGVETVAAILFADISGFSARTQDLTSTETLVFVNNFFCWISEEAMRDSPGIIDKYIGDEIMIVFSEDFGSKDPFADALRTARRIAEHDALSFCPRIGIAMGNVTVGYVGTPLRYNCSVFGAPVTVAKRCTSVQPMAAGSSAIVFPDELWKGRSWDALFPSEKYQDSDGNERELSVPWELFAPRTVSMKHLPEMKIREIGKTTRHFPSLSAEDRAKEHVSLLTAHGMYRPREIN